MRRRIVAGNWKMYGSLGRVTRFCRALHASRLDDDVEVLLFPPVGYLAAFVEGLGPLRVQVGAQNLHVQPEGAYTGEMSGSMIHDLGGRWVLVGHSERRLYNGESNEVVAQKCVAAVDAGLAPILCVGETLEEREAGSAEAVVHGQLQAVLEVVGAGGLNRGAVAYEPVWAIGTDRTATPAQAEDMHGFIRDGIRRLDKAAGRALRILYGGSVKPENAAELFAQDNIDGGLVGGAALSPDSFLNIVGAGRPSPAVDDDCTTGGN